VSKHTPGPWGADDGDGHYFGIFSDETGEPIAYLVEPYPSSRVVILPRDEDYEKFLRSTDAAFAAQWKPHQRLEEHKANANLIAAAPELKDALIEMLDVLIDGEWGTHAHATADRKARAALKKAGVILAE
jgi:hypothetical protein